MCQKSDSIKNIASALGKFQHEVGKITKDEENPFYKSKYASLSTILYAIREPMAINGLSFTQFPTGDGELTTILMHESGEFIMGTYRMVPQDKKPQTLGSSITYQRRYALGAILGLNIDEDDDGNNASGNTASKSQSPENGKPKEQGRPDFKPSWLENPEAMNRIFATLDRVKTDLETTLKGWYVISPTMIEKVIQQYNIHKECKNSKS